MKITFSLILVLFSIQIAFGQCGNTGHYLFPDSNPTLMETDSEDNLIIVNWAGDSRIEKTADITQGSISISFNARVVDIALDSADNIYVCGNYTQAVDFGSGFSFPSPGPESSIFVAKLNPSLQVIWARVSTGNENSSAEGADRSTGITVDNSGNCYLLATYEADFTFLGNNYDLPLSTKRSFVASLDTDDGSLNWFNQQYYDSFIGYTNLRAIENGGFYESVSFLYNYIDDLGNTYTGYPYSNSLLMRYDSAGNQLWGETIRGINEIYSTLMDSSGNLHIYGSFVDTLSFQGDTLFSLGNKELFVGSIDENGVANGFHKIGTTVSNSLVYSQDSDFELMNDGTYYIAGFSYSDVDFNGIVVSNASTDYDYFVAKYAADNIPIWVRSLPNSESGGIPTGVKNVDDCAVYVHLAHYGELFFPDTTYNASFSTNRMLIELDPLTGNIIEPSDLGIDMNLEAGKIVAYPNPTHSIIHYKLGTTTDGYVEVNLRSVNGEIIEKNYPSISQTDDTGSFDMRALAPGIYFLELIGTNNGREITKIAKQ